MLPNVQETEVAQRTLPYDAGNDGRREPRVPPPPGFALQTNGDALQLVDISPGGVQVISPTILRPNALIRLVRRHEAKETRISGIVVWCVLEFADGRPQYRAGIEFSEPAPLSPEPETELSGSPDTIPAGSKTLLVVEDDVSLRNLTVRVLEGHGYTVLQAANGAEAFDIVTSHPDIHLILTDMEMPVMDGFSLIDRLQGQPYVNKLILMSGCADLSSIKIHGRTWPFVTKPFTGPALLQSVQEVLEAN